MSQGYRTFYRDKFNGKISGVCAGLGDYFKVEPLWFRLLFVGLFFVLNFIVLIVYFVIVLVTKKKPPYLYTDSLNRTFAEPNVAEPAGDLIQPASRKGIDR